MSACTSSEQATIDFRLKDLEQIRRPLYSSPTTAANGESSLVVFQLTCESVMEFLKKCQDQGSKSKVQYANCAKYFTFIESNVQELLGDKKREMDGEIPKPEHCYIPLANLALFANAFYDIVQKTTVANSITKELDQIRVVLNIINTAASGIKAMLTDMELLWAKDSLKELNLEPEDKAQHDSETKGVADSKDKKDAQSAGETTTGVLPLKVLLKLYDSQIKQAQSKQAQQSAGSVHNSNNRRNSR